jgi:nucleoside 2-deoxyribosyltransferase
MDSVTTTGRRLAPYGQPSVYLAGPITGLTYDEGNDWRDAVIEELEAAGIVAYSPLRAKNFLREIGVLDAAGTPDSAYMGLNPLSEPKGITARDRFDATRSDVVLMNLVGAKRVSIGTMIEAGWADAARRPVVIAMEEDNVHRHAMLNEIAGFIVPTLAEAVAVVKAVLVP